MVLEYFIFFWISDFFFQISGRQPASEQLLEQGSAVLQPSGWGIFAKVFFWICFTENVSRSLEMNSYHSQLIET